MPEIAGFPESRARQCGFTGREAKGTQPDFCVFPYSLLHHLVAKANNTEEPSRNGSSFGRRLLLHQLLLLTSAASAGDTEEDTGIIQSPASPSVLNHGPV